MNNIPEWDTVPEAVRSTAVSMRRPTAVTIPLPTVSGPEPMSDETRLTYTGRPMLILTESLTNDGGGMQRGGL